MSQKVARVLLETSTYATPEAIAKASPESLAQCLRLSCIFEVIYVSILRIFQWDVV
jgi:hypothetical protein